MLDNPIELISEDKQFSDVSVLDYCAKREDPIFICTRKRPHYLGRQLAKLRRVSGNVNVIYSRPPDIEGVSMKGVRAYCVSEYGRIEEFQELKTSKHSAITHGLLSWDLPIKRNMAIDIAQSEGYERVLLLDDDIDLNEAAENKEITESMLGNNIIGWNVTSFPDTSVVGHLQNEMFGYTGTFISGSCLSIKVTSDNALFASVYNEDWLFLANHILKHSVACIGCAKQHPYNPYKDYRVACFQEFGEILAEGLMTLIHDNKILKAYDVSFWEREIRTRKEYLYSMLRHGQRDDKQRCLMAAINRNAEITPLACVSYLEAYEEDVNTWRNNGRKKVCDQN